MYSRQEHESYWASARSNASLWIFAINCTGCPCCTRQSTSCTVLVDITVLLPSARQLPSYGDCLEVKREYYHNYSVLDCVTQCSQSAAQLCEQLLQSNRLGLSHWDPYSVHRGGCLELYYCNMVEWFWWDLSLIFDDQLVSFSALTLLVWSTGL